MKDLEDYIAATIASLVAGMPAAIAAENARHSDFALPVPGNGRYLFGGEDESDTMLSYPAVVVAAPDADRQGFSLGQADWDVRPVLVVQAWTDAGSLDTFSFQTLYKASMRMGRALQNVLLQPNAFGAGVTVQQLHESYRVNPATGQTGTPRLAYTLLMFTLDDVEVPG